MDAVTDMRDLLKWVPRAVFPGLRQPFLYHNLGILNSKTFCPLTGLKMSDLSYNVMAPPSAVATASVVPLPSSMTSVLWRGLVSLGKSSSLPAQFLG